MGASLDLNSVITNLINVFWGMEMRIGNKNNYLNTSLGVLIKKHTKIFKWKKIITGIPVLIIMKISKTPIKYHLFINFLDQSKIVFPVSKKFKTRPFPYSVNMVFYAEENIVLNQLFRSRNAGFSVSEKFKARSFVNTEENLSFSTNFLSWSLF